MLNILIIDDNNNPADFWRQRLEKLNLHLYDFAITVERLEALDDKSKSTPVDCIWLNGKINNRHEDIKYLQGLFPDHPIFNIEQDEEYLKMSLFLSPTKHDVNFEKLIADIQINNIEPNKADIELQGILSCLSDTVFIYNETDVVFSNSLGQLLTLHSKTKAFDIIKDNEADRKKSLVIPYKDELRIFNVHYIPTSWKRSPPLWQ